MQILLNEKELINKISGIEYLLNVLIEPALSNPPTPVEQMYETPRDALDSFFQQWSQYVTILNDLSEGNFTYSIEAQRIINKVRGFLIVMGFQELLMILDLGEGELDSEVIRMKAARDRLNNDIAFALSELILQQQVSTASLEQDIPEIGKLAPRLFRLKEEYRIAKAILLHIARSVKTQES